MTRSPADLVLRARRVVLPDGEREAAVVVRDGRIAAIVPVTEARAAAETVDCGDACLMPGVVDTHVHVNEPGRTEWEGFATATRAAAAGGVTTLVDMPLNSIPATITVAGLAAKRAAAEAAGCRVDCGFWGGVVPGNAAELEPLASAGVLGFKCFLVPSGVDEFEHVTERDLREAMPILARLGLPLLAHAELPGPIAAAVGMLSGRDPRLHSTWLASRPPESEVEAVRMLLRLAEETGCAVHIVHLATAEALPDLRLARARRVPVTVETCPHYLTFCSEDVGEGDTRFKCAPPIRERDNRERLWQALLDGDIDLVATDHSPCPPALKGRDRGDFNAAWGGIASLELGLSAVWTEARRRGASPVDLARWMAWAPAKLAGLAGIKGALQPGADADLIVWEPDAEWTVAEQELHHRHPLTPYAGRRLAGIVRATFLRGARVFDRDGGAEEFPGAPVGRLLSRTSNAPASRPWTAAAPAARVALHDPSRTPAVPVSRVPGMTVDELNLLPEGEARAVLERCCGCSPWIDQMVARRPFMNEKYVLKIAERVWNALPPGAWREAFTHHPRIGDLESLRRRFASTADLAGREQAAVAQAETETLAALAEGNRTYEEKFGYIFIVFATGRSAGEMLHLLRRRMDNDPAAELAMAAGEQWKIMRLRLARLLGDPR